MEGRTQHPGKGQVTSGKKPNKALGGVRASRANAAKRRRKYGTKGKTKKKEGWASDSTMVGARRKKNGGLDPGPHRGAHISDHKKRKQKGMVQKKKKGGGPGKNWRPNRGKKNSNNTKLLLLEGRPTKRGLGKGNQNTGRVRT